MVDHRPTTRDVVEAELSPLYTEGLPESLNGLSAAFQWGCLQVLSAGLPGRLDEEAFTGALVGAFTTAIPFCISALSNVNSPGFSWVRYRKRGVDLRAETVTGSDFAILVRLANGTSRVALFQAKSDALTSVSLQIHRDAPAVPGRPAESQFARLQYYATRAMEHVTGTEESLASLTWVHYVAYLDDRMACISLDQLKYFETHYGSKPTKRPTPMPRGRLKLFELLWLLAYGADVTKQEGVAGWLNVPDDATASSFLKDLIDIADVYECTVGAELAPLLDPAVTGEEADQSKLEVASLQDRKSSIVSNMARLRPVAPPPSVAPVVRAAIEAKQQSSVSKRPSPELVPDEVQPPRPRRRRGPGTK